MNAENFAEIIRNPAQLYQISYQELKSLVLQYPYCRNLHHLLLQKSHQEQHREFERSLEKTATYSIDRAHLYRQLQALQEGEPAMEGFELREDYLELFDLNLKPEAAQPLPLDWSEEESREANSPLPEQGPAAVPELWLDLDEESDFTQLEEAFQRRSRERPAGEPVHPEAAPESSFQPDPETLLDSAAWLEIRDAWASAPLPPDAVLGILDGLDDWSAGAAVADFMLTSRFCRPETEPPMEKEKITEPSSSSARPLPKSAFRSWNERYGQGPAPLVLPAPVLIGKPRKKDPIAVFAEQSLREHWEVASETLAELLVSQERYEKAIRMYERLILIFPEKSGFFAEKIEKLKKLL